MKKVIALVMAGVIVVSTSMTVVHAESNGEWNLEDELTNAEPADENSEVCEEDGNDQTTSEDMISSSLWLGRDDNGKGHTNLPICVMDYFNNQPGTKKAIIQKCLVFGSEKADCAPLHDGSRNRTQLHAMNNYVLNLNALWLYAKKLAANQSDESCKKQILNELTVKNQDDRKNLISLLDTIPEIYSLYKSQEGKSPDKFEKQYLVLGLALHLIGDIYAHRAIVTEQGVKQALRENVMKKSDFKNFDSFMEEVRQGKVRCSRIDERMKSSVASNRKYEDNTAFMPNRFVYSKKTCKAFISNYVQSGSVFRADYIRRSDADGIILQAFNEYL